MNKTKAVENRYHQKTQASRFNKFLKRKLFSKLENIRGACLHISEGHEKYQFGQVGSSLSAHLIVHDQSFYTGIGIHGSVGAAESYIKGGWDVDNLTGLVRILVVNRSLLDEMEGGFAWFRSAFLSVWHMFNKNTSAGSKKNIAKHYDLGNDFFSLFLDRKMMYSSAIYQRASDDLETASEYKLYTICEKLQLKPTDRVIEIGTGWGGFAIYAAQNYGCHITTTTISKKQYSYTKKLVKEKNLKEKITVLNKDYRDIKGQYDKLVSIEMIEAVGHQYLSTYLNKCNDLLTNKGLALIQAITIEDYRYEKALKSVDFIKRYIFPGSFIPSVSIILQSLQKATQLKLINLEDIGESYSYTLRDWRQRFQANSLEIEQQGYDESFQRMWFFYLCYCEGGFIEGSISDVHLLLAKPGNQRSQLLAIQ